MSNTYSERGIDLLLLLFRVYSDSVRAEEAIKQRAPDVVISDITRGDDPHAGFEFIARLRRTGYEGPVVFFTGRVTAQRRERAE